MLKIYRFGYRTTAQMTVSRSMPRSCVTVRRHYGSHRVRSFAAIPIWMMRLTLKSSILTMFKDAETSVMA
jgi:hypothetical protein